MTRRPLWWLSDSTRALLRPSASVAIPGEFDLRLPASEACVAPSGASTCRGASRFYSPPPHWLPRREQRSTICPGRTQSCEGFPKIFLDPNGCAPAKKAARSAKRQDQQAGTEQEKAGDGHRKEGIGGKFVTHCSHSMRAPLSIRRSLRSWICGFSHPCAAIFPIEHAETCPHDRTPLFDRTT
jgi:hypothetical protein